MPTLIFHQVTAEADKDSSERARDSHQGQEDSSHTRCHRVTYSDAVLLLLSVFSLGFQVGALVVLWLLEAR